MLKIFPTLVLIALLAGARSARAACDPSSGGTVEAVDVTGNEVTTTEAIRNAVGLEAGDEITVTDLAQVENALVDLGSFSKVTAVLVEGEKGCRLAVTVEEYPPVVSVDFEGVTAYSEEDLLDLLTTKVGEPPNVNTITSDAEVITGHYRKGGYDAARVSEVDLTDGKVTFTVHEGRIVSLEVRGARRTGRSRVLELLGIEEGDLYNSLELHEAQRRLYRTELFALVGFGSEVVGPEEAPEGIALTVRVQEFVAPSFHARFTANQSVTTISASQEDRNVRRGHRLRAWGDFEVAAPADLAGTGFDDFYHFQIGAQFRQFRPPWRPYNAVLRVEYERTKRRERPDLGFRYSLDAPVAAAILAFPLTEHGEGSVGAYAGWFEVDNFSSALPDEIASFETGAHGRVEMSTRFLLTRGLETPGRLFARTGVEFTEGRDPFAYIELDGRYALALPYGQAVLDGEAGALGGAEIPHWREFRLGGARGPLGYNRDFVFARRFLLTELAYEIPVAGDLVIIRPSYEAVAYDGATKSGFRSSTALRVGVGPEFLRASAGVAAPLDHNFRVLWWTLELELGTPF